VSVAGALGCVSFGFGLLAMGTLGDRWVPVVDHANLVFHEAGHVILGLLSGRLAVYGGTLGQLAFPVLALIVFWRRREPLATALAAFWVCQNLLNIATYLGDARALALPLIGGSHDWQEILGRFGLLGWDTRLAALLRFCAWCGGLATAAWLGLQTQAKTR
jgi:hypothetical protein